MLARSTVFQGRLPRAAAYGLVAGAATLLLIGIPTAAIPNRFFERMVPATPANYVVLALTVLLAAALGASYSLSAASRLQEGKLTAGGMLSFLAVGCPVCNKIVVLLVGASGAVSYFEPLQPLLGVLSLVLLGVALRTRLRAVRAAGA